MDRAWLDAGQHGWSREPVIEVLIPSTLDDSLAPSANMSPACSASMSPRSFRTANPGTTIATRWPT